MVCRGVQTAHILIPTDECEKTRTYALGLCLPGESAVTPPGVTRRNPRPDVVWTYVHLP